MTILKRKTFNAEIPNPKSVTVTLQQDRNGYTSIHFRICKFNTTFQLKERKYELGEMENIEKFLIHELDGYYQMVISYWLTRSISIETNN